MEAEVQAFHVPDYLNAAVPAEMRGEKTRSDVRMLVIGRRTGQPIHDLFHNFMHYLDAGDVLVLNNSRTMPPVLKGVQRGRVIECRLSRRISDASWEVFFPGEVVNAGELIQFYDGISAIAAGKGSESPLVHLLFSEGGPALWNMIYKHGEPIRYEYIDQAWPLDAYQTVYGSVPGSVEMPSAGRAFTWDLLQGLMEKGVKLAYLQLHAGLSYYQNNRWPDPDSRPEPYHVPAESAKIINEAKSYGGRIIAAGTTVVRALETAAGKDGSVEPGGGETTLFIHGNYPLKMVDGLLTGFHEPKASHLNMLSAFTEESRLLKIYREALQKGYLWHEFGDMNLILPEAGQQ